MQADQIRFVRFVRPFLVLGLLVGVATPLHAQSFVDGQRVEFVPSAENNTVIGGVAVVSGYSLNIYAAGSSTVVSTANLGKPAPDPDGSMRVAYLSLLTTPLQIGVTYEARVIASGPGGSTPSAVSNTFVLTSLCSTSTISPGSASPGAGATSGSVTVTSTCAWGSISNASWITITSGGSGGANGTLNYSVAANSGGARSGTISVAGQTFTVNQAAPVACSYSIGSTSQSVPVDGGTGSVTVTAGSGCAWTAASNNTPWLTVSSGTSGSGNGSVGFSVTASGLGTTRSGTLTIAGATFTVNQAACGYTLTPTSQSVVAGGATGSVTVAAGSACPWTAASNDGWIQVTSGASGTGGGSVGFSAAANTGAARAGTITIGGQTFTVNQPAPTACSYSIGSTSQSVPVDGGTGSVTVTAGSGCAWTAASNNTPWLTVSSGASGSGNGSVGFSVTPSGLVTTRSGTLTIAGATFTVNQAACGYTLTPTNQSVVAGGATGSVTVAAGSACPWTATSNAGWIQVTSGASGTGGGSVGFSAAANSSGSRSGTITIGGQTFTVNQSAANGCSYSLVSTSASVSADGGTGQVTVAAGAGCAWTAASNDTPWLTVTSGATGTGIGGVGFSATPSSLGTTRTGTLTIAGATFTVNQAACGFTLAPASQSVAAAGATGSLTVATGSACPWTAGSNAGWLQLTSVASGTGGGSVGFSASANPGAARAATIAIGGQAFIVNQAAGAGCSYAIGSTSQSVGVDGGTGSVTVTAGNGCAWTAVSNDTPWLTVSSGASGSGNGGVGFSVSATALVTTRSGTLTIAGATFSVTQAACGYVLTPATQSVTAGGGAGSVTVATGSACPWTAASNAGWIRMTSATTGAGGGTIAFTADANPGAARSGTIAIGGQTFTVNEDGCAYTVTPTSLTFNYSAVSGTFFVSTSSACSWTAGSTTSWVTLGPGATGSGTVSYSLAANTRGSDRTGTVTIAGQTINVTQTGAKGPTSPNNVKIKK